MDTRGETLGCSSTIVPVGIMRRALDEECVHEINNLL